MPLHGWDPLRAVGGNYVELWRRVVRARGWRDRLGVLLRSPSWAPASERRAAPAAPPPEAAVARGQAAVAIALFLLATAGTAGLLWRIEDIGRLPLAGIAAGLVALLWAVGAVLDRRLGLWPASIVGVASATALLAWLRLA